MKTLLLPALLAALVLALKSQEARPSPLAPASGGEGNQPSHHPIRSEADSSDSRLPLPLLPHMAEHQRANMRDHLAAVQEILAAVSLADFAGVAKASARIESSEQMQQMCSHMGMGAPGFTEMALTFHRTADTIGVAARKRDQKEVLKALSARIFSR